MARIFSTATPGVAPTIAPPASLALFPSLSSSVDMPKPDLNLAVESKLDPGSMYMIAIEAREVSRSPASSLSPRELTLTYSTVSKRTHDYGQRCARESRVDGRTLGEARCTLAGLSFGEIL